MPHLDPQDALMHARRLASDGVIQDFPDPAYTVLDAISARSDTSPEWTTGGAP